MVGVVPVTRGRWYRTHFAILLYFHVLLLVFCEIVDFSVSHSVIIYLGDNLDFSYFAYVHNSASRQVTFTRTTILNFLAFINR